MQKDFTGWNKNKTKLESNEKRPYFHEREIWFCALGANVGYEQDGRGEKFLRPVLIWRKFNNSIFWGIPLSKRVKKGIHYFPFSFISGTESTAILSQLRLIDAKRLSHHVGTMNKQEFLALTKKAQRITSLNFSCYLAPKRKSGRSHLYS